MTGTGDTIFALSSAPGRAGVAVFRISGPASRFGLETIAGTVPADRRASLRTLRDPADGMEIDRGLVLWLPAPDSFTGEDMVELHVHGGRAVSMALVDALGRLDGFRPAEPGEFARRAFENGRIDLTEAEGIADLVNSETEAQRRQAVRQMDGEAGRLYEGWRARLMHALAYLEAHLDFSDEEDVSETQTADVAAEAAAVAGEIARHLGDSRRGERLREGLRVVIAGAPNAGKSTLMNALARRDVAIVSERAGTTRDVIEVHLDLAGYPVILSDTAGLRAADDAIEEEGVRRARLALEAADLVIWLEAVDALGEGKDTTAAEIAAPDRPILRILSKADLATDSVPIRSAHGWDLRISVPEGRGLDELVGRIAAMAADLCGLGEEPAITRARHRKALEEAHDALGCFSAASGAGAGAELLAEDLRRAVSALGRITGRVDVEDLLDIVFADFCIGK